MLFKYINTIQLYLGKESQSYQAKNLDFLMFLKLKKYNGIREPKIISVKITISEEVDENNSNDNKNKVIIDIASPSIPSIKFIDL